MSAQHTEHPAPPHAAHGAAHGNHDTHYVRVWAILVGLLVVSVIGPMFGVQIVTLITAFGIACVKAYLVAKNFMHINMTKRFVPYLVATGLVFMLLFFSAVAPDVMKDHGSGWEKPAWRAAAAAWEAGDHGAAGDHH
jgi:caa(3)-type oxidase subunit IV